MLNSFCFFNSKDLSVETCIIKLVKIALKRKASSIAVRFDPKKHKIQVVDNGIGFSKYELSRIFNNKEGNNKRQRSIFNKIRFLSDAVIITSRSKRSPHTYVTVASVNKIITVFKGYHRPSKGTTTSIYGFNFSKWNNQTDKNCTISYVIAAIALVELKVSFSLRNDEQQKIIFNISNFHNPWEVLKYLKNNKAFEMPFHSITQVLQKNKIVFHSEETEWSKEISNPSLLNVCSDLFVDNEIDAINNNKNFSSLSEWKNINKNLIENENVKDHNIKTPSSSNQINISDQNFINLSQMSVWSNWSYHPNNSNINDNVKNNVRHPNYTFLPISIYKILPYKNCKLLGDNNDFELSQYPSLNIFNDSELNTVIRKTRETAKYFQKVTNVRVCNMKRKFNECRISGNTINSLQILRQINREFIAAVTNENGKKLLIMIDQHAVHERIRYECLIETYKEKKNYNFLSVKLNKELWISDIDENLLKVIVLHKKIFMRVGINVKSITDSTTCIVDTVPKCFIKKIKNYNHEYNLYRLIKNVRLLLLEVANGLKISKSILPPVLPITIHNVIASEACHGAIKFGDPLSVSECTLLIRALQDTKAPTRCAHGRPSIIPLMDLSDLEKRKICLKVCIMFVDFFNNKNLISYLDLKCHLSEIE